jgi:hypothetical protein
MSSWTADCDASAVVVLSASAERAVRPTVGSERSRASAARASFLIQKANARAADAVIESLPKSGLVPVRKSGQRRPPAAPPSRDQSYFFFAFFFAVFLAAFFFAGI